jgi:hypothetical protein
MNICDGTRTRACGLDANHDGIVTRAEIVSFATAGTSPSAVPAPTLLGGFLAAVKGEMALGAGNEPISSLPGFKLATYRSGIAPKPGIPAVPPCLVFPTRNLAGALQNAKADKFLGPCRFDSTRNIMGRRVRGYGRSYSAFRGIPGVRT